jgi:DNA-binding MurR/RpiR family transcriptional regulator
VNQQALILLIKQRYDSLPRQVRLAASFVLDHPHEVAVMSMREQARLAEVPPSTMTRLAKALDLPGYDDVRDVFKNNLRARGNEFGQRAHGLVELNQKIGENALALDVANNAIAHIQTLCSGDNLATVVRAAKLLSSARHIYCLGLRGSFPVAFQFSHVSEYFARNVTLIDGAGESGVMKIMHQLSSRDALLVCSMAPHSRRAMSISSHLAKAGVKLVVITDSASSPIARMASETILVSKKSSSFFDSLVPAFLVSEILVALMAATAKVDVKALVSDTEKKLWGMAEWWGAQEEETPAPKVRTRKKS